MTEVLREKNFFKNSPIKLFHFSSYRDGFPESDGSSLATYWDNVSQAYDEQRREPSYAIKRQMVNQKDITIGEAQAIANLLDVDLWALFMEGAE